MRFVFALLVATCVALATPAPGFAQSPTQSTGAYAPSHLAAARDMLHAFLIDTGTLETSSLQAFELMGHQFRQPILASQMYIAFPPARQEALLAYMNNLGPVVQEEALRGAPQVIEQFAPRVAALFSETHLRDIAAFMRTPEGSSFFLRSVTEGVRREATGELVRTQPSAAEMAAAEAFDQTPAGRAFTARAREMGAVMHDLGAASVGGPHIINRIRRDMCAVLESDCPRGWRS